jgi:ribonuclease PH
LNARNGLGMRGFQLSLGIVSDGRRIQELSLALRQTFEEAVQTQLYPRSQIDISILVMEQDGGTTPVRIESTEG